MVIQLSQPLVSMTTVNIVGLDDDGFIDAIADAISTATKCKLSTTNLHNCKLCTLAILAYET
jgi:hypothetical protein